MKKDEAIWNNTWSKSNSLCDLNEMDELIIQKLNKFFNMILFPFTNLTAGLLLAIVEKEC